MTLALDREYVTAMEDWRGITGSIKAVPLGDVTTRRIVFEAVLDRVVARLPMPEDVLIQDYEVQADDGERLRIRWYAKEGSRPGSGVYFIHGGGMIMNRLDQFDRPVARYVSESGVPFMSIGYRKAPEHPAPGPAEDCYSGLSWFSEHADQFGVDPRRIAVMGESAGGGLAAAIAIMARDRGAPLIAKQILLYPMLDDRTTTAQPNIDSLVTWSSIDNATAWSALLGDAAGERDVSPYAAPARISDPVGLPSLYIDTGDIDIFLNENLAFAQRLASAGVSIEVHVHRGLPHAWDLFCPEIAATVRAREDRVRTIRSF